MPDEPANPESSPPSAETFRGRQLCVRCGYRLFGLPRRGKCPECGLPVERSLGQDLFVDADPAYIRRLHAGAVLVELAVAPNVVFLLVLAVEIVVQKVGVLIMAACFLFASLVLSFLGWWLLASPDPERVQRHARARYRAVRGSLMLIVLSAAALVAGILGAVLSVRSLVNLISFGIVFLMVGHAVRFFTSMLYVRDLSQRIPDHNINQRSKAQTWITLWFAVSIPPILALAAAGTGLISIVIAAPAAVVFVTLYSRLIDRLRNRLGAIRRIQAQAGVEPSPASSTPPDPNRAVV